MLISKILESKNYFTLPNNEMILDLTKSSINFKSYVEYTDIVVVTDDFVMRPDLIADAKLGDPNKFDYILKYNGISNPFSLYEGQILLIPNLSQFELQLQQPSEEPDKDIKENNNIKHNNAPIDVNRIKYVNKIKDKKKGLAPNINDGGDNIVIDDENIHFGDNVTEPNICETNPSKAKVQESIINSKIHNYLNIKKDDTYVSNNSEI